MVYQRQISAALACLRSPTADIRARAAKQLRQCVEMEMRDLSTETYAAFMTELNKHIFELVSSGNPAEQLGGIEAIDALIDVSSYENDVKISKLFAQ